MSNSDVSNWWETSIIDMEPGRIDIRGTPIADLIGNVSFPQMIWLMLRGDLPTDGQSKLLEAALVAAVDHGPQAPSIATARMAITCGVGLQNAMASAVNTLGDVHGGAGEQAVELYMNAQEKGVDDALKDWRETHGKIIPGFGHRFHKPQDPRAPRLLDLVREAASKGVVTGRFASIAEEIEAKLMQEKNKPVPMNIDGATAVIFADLGFEAPLARGIFCLSRSVGILAHAWEQKQKGERNKGPTPPYYRWTFKEK